MRRITVSLCTAAGLVLGGVVPAGAAPPQGQPQASFEWEMAERTRSVINEDFKPGVEVEHRMIEGPIPGEPGLYGGVSSVPLDEINPAGGFEVTLDGCTSTGNITKYEWVVDGQRIAKTTDCSLTTRLPAGQHEVELVANGGGRKSRATQTIEVKDYVIVSMGDSYSSGEGNPTQYDADAPDSTLAQALANDGSGWDEGGLWDYANCHRSTRSGQANAAIDLEQADPHSSVTFIYVACSGAQVDNGILGVKDGNLGGAEDPQAKQVYDLVVANGRQVDAAILGIGGNDIGFVPIVAEGIVQVDAFLSTEALPGFTIADLPVTDTSTPVDADELANLTLKPDETFSNLPPGPPFRTLDPQALHACDSTYQDALLGAGGIEGDDACRESIGTSPAGLAQVAQCLNGDGPTDCVSVPSYYDFTTETYKYQGGQAWPGLGIPADRVFYTEYPDLTTKFTSLSGDLAYCDISFDKDQLLGFLEAIKGYVDDPAVIDALIAVLTPLNLNNIGLTQNEFEWAAEAILGGIDDPTERVLLDTKLTGRWNVRTGAGPLAKTTIGAGEDVDFVNLGTASPALNEAVRLSEARYGWTAATGTFEAASGHGLCNVQPDGLPSIPPAKPAYAYLVGPAQGTNASGSAHPNLLGLEAYRTPIFDALSSALGL